MSKVLFVLKRRHDYDAVKHSNIGLSTGLYNSASFMNDMLNSMRIDSEIAVVEDNNRIDAEVTKHKPNFVIVEALWVVPQKFSILQKLHPKVKWIIRVHSEMPFMAGEGMAMDWMGDYMTYKNVILAINAPRMLHEVRVYVKAITGMSDSEVQKRVIYLPNYYPKGYEPPKKMSNTDEINISCFGAIRPLKNHLLQAIAAVDFAEKHGKRLKFHINAGRIEMNGNSVLNNLKGVFQHLHSRGHDLINHTWRPRNEFLKLCSTMDIGMQVSLSETFNIVSADLLSMGVPIVTSKREVPWAVGLFTAEPTDSVDISNKLDLAYKYSWLSVKTHQISLSSYSNDTKDIWLRYFGGVI